MKTFTITTLFVLVSTLMLANTRRADRLFARWEYHKAAKLYTCEAKKHPSQDVYYKLGQCYQKMFKYPEALAAYNKVDSMGAYGVAGFYMDYGLVLKSSDMYRKAKEEFTIYKKMAPEDPEVAVQLKACNLVLKDQNSDLPINIIALSSLNTPEESFSPVLYKDGLVFTSSMPATRHHKKYPWNNERYLELYYSKENKSNTDFSNAIPVGNVINKRYHDGPATFSPAFDTIYINRVSKDLHGIEKKTLNIERNKIYMAHMEDNKWVDATPFKYNSDLYSVATPFLSRDGKRLYFCSDMPGGYGETDLYYCAKEGNSWGAPINLGPTINTIGKEKFPTLDEQGTLYFSSDGYAGYGGMDMCAAKQSGNSFEQAKVLKSPLNSGGNDEGLMMIDQKTGYFSSDRQGGKGDADLYYFNMEAGPCTVQPANYVIGYTCADLPVVYVEETEKEIESMPIIKVVNILIHFNLDEYAILPQEEEKLDEIIEFLEENPKVRVDIVGHTDSRASAEYNAVLSLNRAQATMAYLESKGINAKRMRAQGRGFSEIVNECAPGVECSEEKHRQNRRVEFKFREKGKIIVPETVIEK